MTNPSGGGFDIDPEAFGAAASTFEAQADTLSASLQLLISNLATAGACWGADTEGAQFGAGYLPQAKQMQSDVGDLVIGMERIAAALKACAGNYQATDEGTSSEMNSLSGGLQGERDDVSLTSGLSDWLAAQGIWCPEGDGDTLRTAAAAWTAMGTAIDDIGVTLTAAATTLGGTTTGAGTSAFSTYWESWSGPTGYLAVSAAYCSSLATALSGFATDVDIAGAAVLEGIEWAITQSNLTGGTPFTPGVVPDAVPAGVTPAAIAELRTAIEEFAATLGAAAAAQAASAGVTAIDPTAPPATPTAPVTTTTTATAITATPLTQAPDLSQVGVLAAAPDLGSLAKTALDFGAGQGTVLAPDGSPVALPAAAPLPTAAELTDPTGGAPLDWSSPVVPTTVIPAASTVPSSLPLSSVARPTALLTAALGIGKAVRSAAHAVSSHDALGAAGAGGGGGGSFSVPPLAKIPTSKFSAGAPITVPPPSAATFAAEKSAADAAKLAAGKSSGSMPFMPMGMGGAGAGGGGDEQDEARRRKRRI